MKEIIVNANEAGQRLDKLVLKYLNKSTSSFVYKMLRKKNITLNGGKAAGNEKLVIGDSVKLFLSDETIDKFSSRSEISNNISNVSTGKKLDVIYEDDHIIAVNKPYGVLSQKAEKDDVSINEDIIKYLIDTNKLDNEQLKTFKPSVCNRLDRNTTGIVLAGKTLPALQFLSAGFKDRSFNKYYLALVKGEITDEKLINGWLLKDEKTNKVKIFDSKVEDSVYIETKYKPLKTYNFEGHSVTLLRIKLITGKTHQLRAHLASIGHAIIGDSKYGYSNVNEYFKKNFKVKYQLLHSYEFDFGNIKNDKIFDYLNGQTITADLPNVFSKIVGDMKNN